MADMRGLSTRFARCPGRLEHAAAGVLFVWILFTASDAAIDPLPILLAAAGILVLGGLWLLRFLVSLRLRARRAFGAALTAREWGAWIVLPLLLFVAYAAARFRLPLEVRFALSVPAFDDYAANAKRGVPTPSRLGLYPVVKVDFDAPEPHIVTVRPGLFGFVDAGFVRLPDGPRSGIPGYRYQHLRGDWYVFRSPD